MHLLPFEHLQDRVNALRFDYHRSLQRASYRQIQRLLKNRLDRPVAQHLRRHASIGLTHRCQNHCEWCATGAYRRERADELSTQEVESLLADLAESAFVFNSISFIGGECLLRNDLDHLIQSAAERGLLVHLSTNGLKLDQDRVRRLLKAGLNSVFVAFSPDDPVDDRARRQRELVLRGVTCCVEQGLPCFLSVCVCREHVASGKLERLKRQAQELRVAGVRLLQVRLSGKWLWESPDKVLSPLEEEELRRLCKSGFTFLTDDAAQSAGRRCGAAAGTVVYLSPYGDVQPCHFFPYSFGNTRRERLDDILVRLWSHPLLKHKHDDCLLQDPDFRARHVLPIARTATLPLSV